MTTPHLVEPPSMSGAIADVELSPMSRRRYRGSHMRIIGVNGHDLAAKTVQFMRGEETRNAQPEWSWIEATDISRTKLSVRCEIAGIQFGGEIVLPIDDFDDEAKCEILAQEASRVQRQLEQMVARFVLYGAR